jgi:P pilus assembly chaperone PapD
MVVVALGEPGTPVVFWAIAGIAPIRTRVVAESSDRNNRLIVASLQDSKILTLSWVCAHLICNVAAMSAKGHSAT